MLIREASFEDAGADRWRLRRAAVAMLRTASRLLDRLAESVARGQTDCIAPDLSVEFHAEAGALEGALYVDGQLVGRLAGINRL